MKKHMKAMAQYVINKKRKYNRKGKKRSISSQFDEMVIYDGDEDNQLTKKTHAISMKAQE